jgi:hypothetical protein
MPFSGELFFFSALVACPIAVFTHRSALLKGIFARHFPQSNDFGLVA